ncbi:MAG TPA: hypothetical protein VJL33_01695 [Candidatus Bathyarchaeia archaeon]|nr:hypothetical protein [Candidatus Bathyarchaeia archaeon]
MINPRKLVYVTAGILAFLIVIFLAQYYGLFQSISYMFGDLGTANTLAIVNGVATAMLAIVATMNGIEAKKVRSELVKPRLALEPTYYEYDTKTGEIIGFNCLNLVNGGIVARDVEIDFSCKGKTSFLYASSIGTNDRIQIWSGQSSELGGDITVAVKYKNMYNKSLHEVLSINIDSVNAAKRKFAPVYSTYKA